MLKLYPRLAWQNVRKNYRVTVPYMLSGAGIIMMYYMIYAIKMGCDAAEMLSGSWACTTSWAWKNATSAWSSSPRP